MGRAKAWFGTDGIRGIANQEPMSPMTLLNVGKAVVKVFQDAYPGKTVKVVVGRDTRISGFMIESALAAGICSQGGRVRLVGEMPTAGIAFTTMTMRADAGIMISASHNPFEDNGVKIFSSDGSKISEEWEKRIEYLLEHEDFSEGVTGRLIQRAKSISDAPGRYSEHLKNTFPQTESLKGLKIVLDCANGAAYRVAPLVFEELNAELIVINDEPDGTNINKHCGATSPKALRECVIREKADIGIALDGDADRAIFIDHRGELQDGDTMIAICADAMNELHRLRNKTVVVTQMSNYGFELAMRKRKIQVIRTDIGDRYVVAEMKKRKCNLGGEQSGHVIFFDHGNTGDGIVTALQVLAVMQKKGKTLSELSTIVEKIPQILVNVKVKEKRPISTLDETSEMIRKLQKKLSNRGRILVRYSGTENLARIMIEGKNESEIKTYADEVADQLKKELNQPSSHVK